MLPKGASLQVLALMVAVACVVAFLLLRQRSAACVSSAGPCSQQTQSKTDSSSSSSYASPEFDMSGKIDEHLTINNERRDVNFCGKTYAAPQVIFDGVDVVQRIAALANKNVIYIHKNPLETGAAICSGLAAYYYEPTTLRIWKDITTYVDDNDHLMYIVCLTQECFDIDSVTHEIFISAIGDGSALIGKLQ
jgi:hypothetical protein